MIFTCLNAQNDKVRWNDLFSYNNVKFLEQVKGIIYCGTENGIFLFNPQNPTADWIKLNKTNYLNNVDVSAMAYDEASDAFLVGYANGGLDLLKSGESTMVLDIKWNGFNGDKKVNNIYIHDGIAFISGAFGVVSYSLAEEEFKETTRTNTFVVNDATVLNNTLYIATSNGIYSNELKNKLNNPNINTWTTVISGQNISNIELNNNEVYYAVGSDLRNLAGSSVGTFNTILDLKSSNNKLVITQNDQVSILGGSSEDITYQEKDANGVLQSLKMNFNTAIFINNTLYGGTTKFGLVDFSKKSTYNVENAFGYSPDGPYNNNSFSVTTKNGKVWIAPGGTDGYTNVLGNADGFFYYNAKKWINFSSQEIFGAKDILKIAAHPAKDNNSFVIASFNKDNRDINGRTDLLEFGDDLKPTKILTNQFPSSRIAGISYDQDGNLYVGTSFPDNFTSDWMYNYYASRTNGSWKTIQKNHNIASVALSPETTASYIYYPNARDGGITVLDKNNTEVITITTSNSKLPINNVLALASDKSNTLWIGTGQGLVILYGADDAIATKNINVEPIVIVQDGIPEALLTDVGINAIKVDNANRKWIATDGAGVYYVSDSGDRTILHFTSKNSPLPSDIVYDISVDESTGKVYFATEKGVVSYNGDVSSEATNFSNAIAYPNPYRPEYNGKITIKNLPNRALVKITDVVGNLIYESKAEGGIVEWDTNNAKGKAVASGIYLVLMMNSDGTETKTLKIAVVR
ncbi:Two component regulator propeller [Algoriella xinjiangensis]|uniref:Two component regulator propeller n=2 Tax=Algoriella xinjiangensis TaxID=684065 RepID=A0A1I4U2B8_9FLAO|nr:Two component regulator propeller [Algoriella xinjiangensis]VDH17795.1 Two component regulator propeller [Algoriella xinjiangensis]